jgi:Asp-tRNA(Asn)/Glu-tRNA(Gln) amidotransferase A subunit family amidase
MESLRDVDACLMTGPTNAMHFCGLPSVALRLGMDASGAPCGMILYGADEKRLFSAALCIEQYAGPISWPQGIE